MDNQYFYIFHGLQMILHILRKDTLNFQKGKKNHNHW